MIELTPAQEQVKAGAVDAIIAGNDVTLEGPPGVGKTTTAAEIVRALEVEGYRIAVTATTNKATSVIAQALADAGLSIDASTVHKLAGLSIREVEGRTELVDTGRGTLHDYDVVLLDEASMVGDDLYEVIIKQAATGVVDPFAEEDDDIRPVKFIFLGDRFQLNPVGQAMISKVFLDTDVTQLRLTEIVRQKADNPIIGLLGNIREYIEHELPITPSAFSETRIKGLQIIPREELRDVMRDSVNTPGTDDIFLGWRNRTVDQMNRDLRELRFGDEARRYEFLKDEIIMLREPIVDGMQVIANTGDTFRITQVDLETDEFEGPGGYPVPIKFWLLKVDGLRDPVRIVDNASSRNWQAILSSKRLHATRDKSLWQSYYSTRAQFHNAQTRYALTAHRSQGSTYDRVVVDVGDVLANNNFIEAARALYVAASRPRHNLALVV